MSEYKRVLLSFLLFCCNCLIAQKTPSKNNLKNETKIASIEKAGLDTIVVDTAQYAQSVKNNKIKYIGKELGIFLKDLTIKPKSYSIGITRKNVNIVPSILLSFDDVQKTSKRDGSDYRLFITIIFKDPILSDDASKVRLKSTNPGDWQEAEQAVYSKQIIGDIQ